MPTSARWEAAKSPEIPVKSVYSAGGQSRPPLRSTGGSETLLQGSTTLSARLGSYEFAEEFCKNGLFCAGRCRHRPLQPNAHVPADSPKISKDSVRPAGQSGPAPTRTLRLQEKRPEFSYSGRRRSPWYHLYSRLRGHSQLCNGRTRRGLLCVQPGGSEATGTSALRKLTPAASSLRRCAKFVPLLSLYRYGKLMRYTSSMMGEGLACCGLTRARNLLRDSRISPRACAMASSVRFMESST